MYRFMMYVWIPICSALIAGGLAVLTFSNLPPQVIFFVPCFAFLYIMSSMGFKWFTEWLSSL